MIPTTNDVYFPEDLMEGWWQDLRLAVRSLTRRRQLTVAALLTLALGIGANTAFFTLFEAVVIDPLPYPGGDRMVELKTQSGEGSNWMGQQLSNGTFHQWRDEAKSLDGATAFQRASLHLNIDSQDPVAVEGVRVSSGFFEFLGSPLRLGRAATAEESEPGSHRVVVLSDKTWRSRFGADPQILGRRFDLDGESHSVIGVLPPRFRFVESPGAALFVPLIRHPLADSIPVVAFARLQPGASVQASEDELTGLLSDRGRQPHQRALLWPLAERLHSKVRQPILWLQAAAGIVLLIACVNVALLLLAQGQTREHELATRAALGASHWRLSRQLFAESLVLATLAGLAGLLVAWWSLDVILTLAPSTLDHLQGLSLDRSVLAFNATLAALTALLFGLPPTLRGSKPELSTAFQGTSLAKGIRGRLSCRVLVGCQAGLSFCLLLGALLIGQELRRLGAIDFGYTVQNVRALKIELPPQGNALARGETLGGLLDELMSTPFPSDSWITPASGLPSQSGVAQGVLEIEGQPTGVDTTPQLVRLTMAGPQYFRTLKIPLLAGRGFLTTDRQATERVAVIDETLAQRLWPGTSPIGARFRQAGQHWHRVVGVTPAVRESALYSADRPQIYHPSWLSPMLVDTLILRTAADPQPVSDALQTKIRALAPEAVVQVTSASDIHRRELDQHRFNTFLTGLFAALAISLMSVGVYGTVTWSVLRRVREIGIRKVLGAEANDLTRRELANSLLPVAAGLGVGAVAAVGLLHLAQGFLAGLVDTSSTAQIATAAVILVVATVAAWSPARQAARIEPMQALHED
ncbi:MAG: ABC transporter permease [Acidobacteriota bacterium]